MQKPSEPTITQQVKILAPQIKRIVEATQSHPQQVQTAPSDALWTNGWSDSWLKSGK
ncbi:MAG: hypothetical protein JWM41_506 [Gemmatimonadetes bacterium]|nr:hypothetical protein [Gemmatimonadota bacterium]